MCQRPSRPATCSALTASRLASHWRPKTGATRRRRPRGSPGWQYPDADLIDAIAKVDGFRFSHSERVGVDARGAAPDEAHPTIPGYLLRTSEDKEAFLGEAPAVLLRRMDQRPTRRAA